VVRNLGVAGLAVAAVALAAASSGSCGGSGGEVDLSDVDEVTAGALRAVSPPAEVGHLTWEWREGDERWAQETWVDADNGRFRTENRPGESGEEGSFHVIVGEKWRIATYQSDVESYPVRISAVDREEAVAGGLDNLAYLGDEYLRFVAWADERRVVGESTADGREVVVVEAKRVMDGDWQAGTVMVATIELDKATLLPVGLRSRIVEPDGKETEAYSGQSEWEAVPPDDLPPDFFSPDALFALYSPVREILEETGELGYDLYWLGEKYEDVAEGELDLYLWGVDIEGAAWASLRYASETLGGGGEVVIIREGQVGQAQFGPLGDLQGPGGLQTPKAGPIESQQVTVQGEPATLYSRTDIFSPTYEVTYRWLVVTLGETTIELYPVPISEEGQEENPLNDTEALIALAQGLVPVPDEP